VFKLLYFVYDPMDLCQNSFLIFLQGYGSTHLPDGGTGMEMPTAIVRIMDCYMFCNSPES